MTDTNQSAAGGGGEQEALLTQLSNILTNADTRALKAVVLLVQLELARRELEEKDDADA